MTTTAPAPFSFDSWLDTGTAAQVVKHRYNDLAAVHAYREIADQLHHYREEKAKRAPRGEEGITDAVASVVTGEASITDIVSDDEAELVAAAEAAWARVEASMETWTIRALNHDERAYLRETYPAPESPKKPGAKATKISKAKYQQELQAWADAALTTRLTQTLAMLSAATVSIATPAGTSTAQGLVTDETHVPAVTIEQLRRIRKTPGAEAGIDDLASAVVETTTADSEPTAPFWRPTSESAPG